MTQLLISVRNADEALIALQEGAEIIDLKDPQVGALGALDIEASAQILQVIQQQQNCKLQQNKVLSSATVGENHANLSALVNSIQIRANMGVNLIKVSVSEQISVLDLATEISNTGLKLVGVFFADQPINFDLLQNLKDAGFYGAMLDTSNKGQSLLETCTLPTLQKFTQICQNYGLKSGLAGSLKALHIEYLMESNPSYIGFRGGVCESDVRNNVIARHKIVDITKLLRQHNKFNALGPVSSNLALHS